MKGKLIVVTLRHPSGGYFCVAKDIDGTVIAESQPKHKRYPKSVGGAKRSWVWLSKQIGFDGWEYAKVVDGVQVKQLEMDLAN